jgi:hypothetical protein
MGSVPAAQANEELIGFAGMRVPLFHNSCNDGVLPPAFHQSAGTLLAKYSALKSIPTLCGTLSPGPLR